MSSEARAAGRADRAGRARPRTAARVAAVQALYQIEHNDTVAEPVIEEFQRHRLHAEARAAEPEAGAPGEADARLFAAIVRGAARNRAEIDPLVAGALPADWALDRLDPVLRALLRAAAGELLAPDGPPPRVVLNEYLDVAHSFFSGQEPGLANGVLDNIARQLKPAEMGPSRKAGADPAGGA